MKRLLLLAILALASLVSAQTPVSTTLLTLPVQTLNASPVPGAELQIIGSAGQAFYCYWASANFPIGSLVSALGCVSNAANTLSGSNYVQIAPYVYPAGVTTVDILRTTSFLAPTGACNCAVATGLTSGSANDQSNSLSSYTVSVLNPNSFPITFSNEVQSAGVTHLIMRQGLPFPGTKIADLSNIGASGVTGSGTGQIIPIWSGSGTSTALANSSLLEQTGVSQANAAGIINAPPAALDADCISTMCAAFISQNNRQFSGGGFNTNAAVWGKAVTATASLTAGGQPLTGGYFTSSYGIGGAKTLGELDGAVGKVSISAISHADTVTAEFGLAGIAEAQDNTVSINAGVYAKANSSTVGGTNAINAGIYIDSPGGTDSLWDFGGNAGTLTLHAGLYIKDQTAAGGGTNSSPFSIYQLGLAPNRFAGPLQLTEGAAVTAVAGQDVIYADSTAHAIKSSLNGGSFLNVPQVIASGTSTLGSSAIASAACATVVTTAASGTATTDSVEWAYASAPATADGELTLTWYVTSGNVNWKLCNGTAGSLTPSGLVVNWRVLR